LQNLRLNIKQIEKNDQIAKKYTKIAIAYDFDGTLAPGNMQEHSFIPKLGINKAKEWFGEENVFDVSEY
jgi:hypothetical protein